MSKEHIEELVEGMQGGVTVEEAPQAQTKTVGGETQLEAWQGPFAEYTFVPVPSVGEFAVPAFKVMTITMVQEWDTKQSQWVWRAHAKYRKATDTELERAGILEAKNYQRPSMDPKRSESAGEAKHHSEFNPQNPPPGIDVTPGGWNPQAAPLDPDFG